MKKAMLLLLTLALLVSAPLLPALRARLARGGERLSAGVEALGGAASLALLVLCAAALASGGFAPFIYFQF